MVLERSSRLSEPPAIYLWCKPLGMQVSQALRNGRQVNVDWKGWRVDGVNHNLWDFISPDVKAAYLTVARPAGHTVPEGCSGSGDPRDRS